MAYETPTYVQTVTKVSTESKYSKVSGKNLMSVRLKTLKMNQLSETSSYNDMIKRHCSKTKTQIRKSDIFR